jgi:TatD DNase family protein
MAPQLPQLIDTHCHLDSPRFDEDRPAVLERAWASGVSGIVIPAVGPDTWDALLALPATEARIQVGLGIHPQLLPELPEADDERHLERLDALLSRGIAGAVGECGLDGPSASGAPVERQVRVLRRHLALARKHALPLLVHCYKLHPALLQLLESEPLPERGLLLHSYSGALDLAKRYSKLGCQFSLAGPVTYPGARKPLAALANIPLDRLMVETDAPDQAPEPHRGQRCEPSHLPLVAAAVARTLGISLEELAVRTTENARRLFGKPF